MSPPPSSTTSLNSCHIWRSLTILSCPWPIVFSLYRSYSWCASFWTSLAYTIFITNFNIIAYEEEAELRGLLEENERVERDNRNKEERKQSYQLCSSPLPMIKKMVRWRGWIIWWWWEMAVKGCKTRKWKMSDCAVFHFFFILLKWKERKGRCLSDWAKSVLIFFLRKNKTENPKLQGYQTKLPQFVSS